MLSEKPVFQIDCTINLRAEHWKRSGAGLPCLSGIDWKF